MEAAFRATRGRGLHARFVRGGALVFYKKIVLDGEALLSAQVRAALCGMGVACAEGRAPEDGALFVSSDPQAVDAAFAAGFACALALWNGVGARHVRATHYLRQPYDLVALLERREEPFADLYWMRASMEMQFIAQNGLAYSKDPYDIERFERLRDLAAEMLARGSGLPEKTVRDVFLCERGYQTPKIDTRAAIVENLSLIHISEPTRRS